MASIVAAMTGPQSVMPSLFCNWVRPTGRVPVRWSSDMRNGHRYSFHSLTTVMMENAMRVGHDIGMTTLRSSFIGPAPSMRAASMISLGIDRNWLRMRNVPNATPASGRMMPW